MRTKDKYIKGLEDLQEKYGNDVAEKSPGIFYPLILDVLCEINDNLKDLSNRLYK